MEMEKLVQRMDTLDKVKSKTCPSCHSVFVNDHECEACGFQLKVDLMGEPYSDRSYYGLREKFYANWPATVKAGWTNLNPKHPESIRYRRFLEHRLTQLMSYFFKEFDADKEKRKQFLMELEDLLVELNEFGADIENLFEQYDSYFKHPLYSTISDLVLAAQMKPVQKTSSFQTWWNDPWWGLVRPSFALKCFFAGALIVYVAMVLFPYLAMRR